MKKEGRKTQTWAHGGFEEASFIVDEAVSAKQMPQQPLPNASSGRHSCSATASKLTSNTYWPSNRPAAVRNQRALHYLDRNEESCVSFEVCSQRPRSAN